jgi:amino acid adenylation domain-containing protein
MERLAGPDASGAEGAEAAARAEQQRIVDRCRHPAGDFEPIVFGAPEGLPAYLAARAATFDACLALCKGAQRLTHRELDALANGLARRILARTRPGPAPVALLFDNGPTAVAAMLAAWKAGKFFVALDPDAPRERLAATLHDAEAELLVAGPAHVERARAAVGAGALPILDAGEVDPTPAGDLGIAPSAGAPACLVYTSGTTGRPKGVMVGFAVLARRIAEVSNRSGACRHDREAFVRSLAFVGDLGVALSTLATGASGHFFDMRAGGLTGLRDFLQREAITILSPGVTLFRQLVETLRPGDALPALRLVRLAGEQVRGEDLAAFQRYCAPGSVLRIGYTSSEAGPITDYLIDQATPLDGAAPPVGYATTDAEVLVLDANDRPCPEGVPGEIVVRSAALALGYWRQPEETAARFTPNPAGGPARLFRTGDRGQWRADGALALLGRVDTQVKVRGNRVEPAEVEAALIACPGVRAAAVTLRADGVGQPWLVAYVVGGTPPPAVEALREALAARLPAYMVPQRFVLLDALPLTLNGKVDVQALPRPPAGRPALAGAPVVPRGPVEALVAAAWQEVLRLEPVGALDTFLDLGGDSIAAMRVVTLLQDRLGRELPATILLTETETVEAMAKVITATLAT